MNLSLLCVTQAEDFAWPFLKAMAEAAVNLKAEMVIACDGRAAVERLVAHTWPEAFRDARIDEVRSLGFFESALDEALTFCTKDYVLRLDDDEKMTPAMVAWLASRAFLGVDLWKFPRLNLFGDAQHALKGALWPDHQTRLSSRAKAGGRVRIHDGSPFGGGELAPCALAHHKFLVKSLEDRRAIAQRYERLQPGAGLPMMVFSAPEDVLTPEQLADTFTFGSGMIS